MPSYYQKKMNQYVPSSDSCSVKGGMAGEGLMLLIGTLRSASFTASNEVTSLPLGMGDGKGDALALQKIN